MDWKRWTYIAFYVFLTYTAISTTLVWAIHFGWLGEGASSSAEKASAGRSAEAEQIPPSAKTFAKNFTKEYLFWTPEGGSDSRAERLKPFLAKGMDPQAGFSFNDNLKWSSYTRTQDIWTIDKQGKSYHATVYAETEMRKGKDRKRVDRWMRFSFIPAGESYRVTESPQLVAAPEGKETAPPEEEKEEESADSAVTASVERYLQIFFKDYTTGSPDEIGYHFRDKESDPGVVGILGFNEIKDVQVFEEDQSYRVEVVVEMEDLASGAILTIPYEIHLTQEAGRWLVLNIEQ
ncbi:MAG: conjugal transfer protein [Firmicutes bacterium]|nr:conjugal transfer protein [Bacillota bacterium]